MYVLLALIRLSPNHVNLVVDNDSEHYSLSLLASGGHSNIYLMSTEDKMKTFALKEMDLYGKNDIKGSTFSELAALCFFDSMEELPLVPVIESVLVSLETNKVYVVMKRYEYSLYDVLSRRVDSSLDPVAVMQSLSCIVSVAHSFGILHLDIKPSNILIWNDTLVLADWGLSIATNGPYHSSTSDLVTITHRPPELLADLTMVGTFTDVWSMGVVMSEVFQQRPINVLYAKIPMLMHWMFILGVPSSDVLELMITSGSLSRDFPLPSWPRRGASRAYSKFIESYIHRNIDDFGFDYVRSLLDQVLDGCLKWRYSKRMSA